MNTPFIVSCPGLVPEGKVSDALVDFTDMYATFTDFAGGTAEAGYSYDGFSLKNVFLGNEEKTQRPWILGMGSHPARLSEQGVEASHYFRDRVIREKRFKLFIGSDRKPEKVVDVLNDPDEKINLMGNPEYKQVCDRLIAVIPSFPETDQDPHYETLTRNEWDLKPKVKSQVHKEGHPQQEKQPKKKRDQRKRGGKKK